MSWFEELVQLPTLDVRDSLSFFDTVFDLLSADERALLPKTFVQWVTYTPEKVQIYLFDDGMGEDLKERVERPLREPELAATGSSGFLDRHVW
jgi:hypothetical protein